MLCYVILCYVNKNFDLIFKDLTKIVIYTILKYNYIMYIKVLFNSVVHIGYIVQILTHQGDSLNGKTIWGRIEKKVDKININNDGGVMKYNESLKSVYVMMSKLIDKYDMNNNQHILYYHCFTQLKNLVDAKSEFKVQIYRILQIAYNIGQLLYFMDNSDLDLDVVNEIKDFVYAHNLHTLDTYVSQPNQMEINKILPEIRFNLNPTFFDTM